MVDNLFVFYIAFEFSLLPTLMLIIKWGYQPERMISGFYFVIYTICASLPLIYIIVKLKLSSHSISTSLVVSADFGFVYFYLAFLIAFLVKLPIWGVHL